MKNRILSAYATSLLGIVSGLLTNLWLLRAIAYAVDPDSFGLYAFALQITGYLVILQVGLDFAVSRQIAEALGRKDEASANSALFELKRFNRFAGILCLVATFALSIVLFYSTTGVHRARLGAEIALLAGGTQTLLFWSRTAGAALVGSQLIALVNVVTVSTSIATSLLAFLLLKLGLGVLCIPLAGLFMQGGSWACLRRLSNARCSWIKERLAKRNPRQFYELCRYGVLTAVGGIGWTVESTCDVFILQSVMGTEAVAAYVLWWRFPQLAFAACSSLANSAFPTFAEKLAGSVADGAQLIAKIFSLSVGLGTMALVGIGIWLPAFIRLWLGDKYSLNNAGSVAIAMGLLVCIRAYGNLLATIWLARGRAKLSTALCWGQAGLKLLLGIWWVTSFGLVGIIAASCCTMLIQCAVFGTLLYQERFLPGKLAVKSIFLPLFALLLAWGIAGRVSSPSLLVFIAGIFATFLCWGSLWFALAWRGELGPKLRQWSWVQPSRA